MTSRWVTAVEVLFVAALVFFAAGATDLARSIVTVSNPVAIAAMCALALVVAALRRVPVTRRFVCLISAFVLLFLVQTLDFGVIHVGFLLYYLVAFVLAYCAIASLGVRFFAIYERIIVVLAAISLVLWTVLLAEPIGTTDVLMRLTFLEPYSDLIRAHVLVFTIVGEQVESILPRNSGFAWEPGAFAVFLGLGIYVNLVTEKFRFKRNVRLLVLVISLLTTQSTTGYSIFLLLGAFVLINQKNRFVVIGGAPLAVAAGLYVATLPFMYEKVSTLFAENVNDLSYVAGQAWNRDRVIYAQRFASLQIDFEDFLANPVVGYGGHDEEMWTRKEGLNVVSISGVGKVLAKFGVVGFFFVAWASLRSAREIVTRFPHRGAWVFPLLLLQIAVSYSLLENALVMCFWMFALFQRRDGARRPVGASRNLAGAVA